MGTFGAELNQLKMLDSSRKMLLAVIFVLLFVLGLLVGGSLLGGAKPTPTPTVTSKQSAASKMPKTLAALTLEPSNTSLTVGQPTQIKVVLSKVGADALDVVINYDPAIFAISALTKGTSYPNYPLLRTDKGKVMISASVTPDKKISPAPPVTVATFTVTPLKKTSASLDFDSKNTIVALGGENVTGLLTGGKYKLE